eukprot:3216161-Pleurochrysis_carterae.AAC.3
MVCVGVCARAGAQVCAWVCVRGQDRECVLGRVRVQALLTQKKGERGVGLCGLDGGSKAEGRKVQRHNSG